MGYPVSMCSRTLPTCVTRHWESRQPSASRPGNNTRPDQALRKTSLQQTRKSSSRPRSRRSRTGSTPLPLS
jgi:hypothetical protein